MWKEIIAMGNPSSPNIDLPSNIAGVWYCYVKNLYSETC